MTYIYYIIVLIDIYITNGETRSDLYFIERTSVSGTVKPSNHA